MTEQLTQPLHISQLEIDTVNLVSSTGRLLGRLALAADTSILNGLVETKLHQVDDLVGLYDLATSAESSPQNWDTGFNAGALQGMRELIVAFAGGLGDSPQTADEGKLSDRIGGLLADLRFSDAYSLLHYGSPADSDGSPWFKGTNYTLSTTTRGFEVGLEQRVLDLQVKAKQNPNEQRLSALLFIAVTSPHPNRVLRALGSDLQVVMDQLEQDELIKVSRTLNKGSWINITKRGSEEAFRLASESEVAVA